MGKGEKVMARAVAICKTPNRGWVYRNRSGEGKVQGGSQEEVVESR